MRRVISQGNECHAEPEANWLVDVGIDCLDGAAYKRAEM